MSGTRNEAASAGWRWGTVALFAMAMAWVESAVVLYLRTLLNRLEPYQPNPLPLVEPLAAVELGRELATMIMLLTVGILAGRRWRARFGYVAIAFGVWDISYYVFLKVMCDWPHSLLDWDVLFLLPLPWWGPVLAPTSIAVLMMAWGTLASRWEPGDSVAGPRWTPRVLGSVGALLALYTFMADALRVAPQGVEALCQMLPARFNWPLFCLAWLLLATPTIHLCWQHWQRTALPQPLTEPNR